MNKITLKINGKIEYFNYKEKLILSDIIKKFVKNYEKKNIAIAVNNNLIKKKDWHFKKLENNDAIEIVMPFPGGWYKK